MYKLIATDCDGTILDSKGYLPSEVTDTFRALHNRGIDIIIATGRSDIIAKDYLDELNIGCPIIGCNGATLANFYTGTKYFTDSMSSSSLKELFDLCDTIGTAVKIFTLDTCYTDSRKLYDGGINLITTKYTKKLTHTIKYELVKDIHSLVHTQNVVKAVIIENDNTVLTAIKDRINAEIPGLKAVQSNWNCIDINNKTVSKGNALLKYASMTGIKPSEIIAFGDSENDVSMLKAAGLGVAVANADKCVKDAADDITDTNDNFGVPKYLKKIFNI